MVDQGTQFELTFPRFAPLVTRDWAVILGRLLQAESTSLALAQGVSTFVK